MATRFEIHLENWNSALHICDRDHFSDVSWLVALLKKNKIRPTVYFLEKDRDYYSSDFWNISYESKSHGEYHYYDEKADRSPYFNQEGIPFPPAGGFFFRILPMAYLRWAIKRSGIFWIHPHDLDENHPKLKNPFMNWKRHVGLKGAKKKLEALLASIDNWN